MLTVLAFTMIAVFMALIMTKRMSVLTALILVPVTFALIAGFRANLGPMMGQAGHFRTYMKGKTT